MSNWRQRWKGQNPTLTFFDLVYSQPAREMAKYRTADSLWLGRLSVDLFPIPNFDHVNEQDIVLNIGNNAVIANAILPKIAEL